jgi:hypothetical protein
VPKARGPRGSRPGPRCSGPILATATRPPSDLWGSRKGLLHEETIGRPVELTVWRRGALVDVIAVPQELVTA